MKYFQQTESIIEFIHKINCLNRNTTFFIYITTLSRNTNEFNVFSEELHEKLRTCRFSAKISAKNECTFTLGSNHYSLCSVPIEKRVKIKISQENNHVYLSLLINTMIPQCPKCKSVQHIRKKLLMLNPAENERVGALSSTLSFDNLIETELIGNSQQFTKGAYCTKCSIAFVPDNKLNRYAI